MVFMSLGLEVMSSVDFMSPAGFMSAVGVLLLLGVSASSEGQPLSVSKTNIEVSEP